MKNILWIAMALAAIWTVGCNRVDTELIGKIQAELGKAQELTNTLQAGEKSTGDLLSQMLTAPDALKGSATFGYSDLYQRVLGIQTKYQGMAAEAAGKAADLQALMDNYTDGKEKKDAVLQQFDRLSSDVNGSLEQSKQIAAMLDELSANYAKMTASWEALPDAEKKAEVQKASKTEASKYVPRDSDQKH